VGLLAARTRHAGFETALNVRPKAQDFMQKIITCLGFNNQAEEAIDFYTTTVKNSKILSITRCGDAGPGPKGSLLAASFLLDGLSSR
jgi:predicted 3-demethylubiquinone-9 3-methyltransferase (glyoxalase superfamily)